jgi:carbamoylphosphate synthase small subunit
MRKYKEFKNWQQSNNAKAIEDIDTRYIFFLNRASGQFERFINTQALSINNNSIRQKLHQMKKQGQKLPLMIYIGTQRLIAWDNTNNQLSEFARYVKKSSSRKANKKTPILKKLQDKGLTANENDIIGEKYAKTIRE